MSQENVEVVRAAIEAGNRGDWEAARESLDPDAIVVRGLEGWPEPAPFVGREAVMRQWQRTVEDLDSWTLEPLSLIDAGDRVVSRQRLHGVGEGPELNVESTAIYMIRRGKVLVIEFYWDHAEALETLGLSEQDAHADS
jgi:ketosteroid isomerase-like protein